MSNNNPIKQFTALDIERYHKGLLSPKERHDLEKAALDDPFLADALEGYTTSKVDISNDLAELRQRLFEKTEDKKVVALPTTRKQFSWMRVAAMIILLVGAGFLVYQFGFNKSNNELATSNIPASSQQSETTSKQDSAPGQESKVNLGASKQSDTGNTSNIEYYATKEKNSQDLKTVDAAGATPVTQNDIELKNLKDQSAASEVSTATAEKAKKETELANAKQQRELTQQRSEVVSQSPPPANVPTASVPINSNAEGAIQNRPAEARRKANTNRADDNYRNYNTFRGRVMDNNNNPVPFANVTNVEDNVGTYADARGNFNLTSPDSVLNVQVKGLGYNVNSQQLRSDVVNNNVVMSEDRSLNEVVISNKKPNSSTRSRNANMKLEGEPEPEDGWDNYDSYLANNLNIPEDYKIRKSGTDEVKLSFEVNKYGEPINIRVEKSLCGRCDQEAIRLVKEGPRWKRKAKKGRTVVTISF